jgi:hypothetical protein
LDSQVGIRRQTNTIRMTEPREKLAQKSNNIMGTPMRGLTVAITPNVKKFSKREQDPTKKIKDLIYA